MPLGSIPSLPVIGISLLRDIVDSFVDRLDVLSVSPSVFGNPAVPRLCWAEP